MDDYEPFPPTPRLLKVFAIKAHGDYCAGMAVVAATTTEEACLLACREQSDAWSVRYHTPGSITELPVKYEGLEPTVLTHWEFGE